MLHLVTVQIKNTHNQESQLKTKNFAESYHLEFGSLKRTNHSNMLLWAWKNKMKFNLVTFLEDGSDSRMCMTLRINFLKKQKLL